MAQGACILAPESTVLSPKEAAFFRQADPWGFILFARNVENPSQVRALTSSLRDAVGRDAAIFVDQEGGRVQRLGPPHWRQWVPPLHDVARAGVYAEQAMAMRYRLIAEELKACGIDGNCVPCADIATPDTHDFLKNRCFGTDPDQVVRMSIAAAGASLAGGVLPVIKHMPGHGRARVDSHGEVPRVTASRAELDSTDFAAFMYLAFQPVGMTGHVIFESIDDLPATLSPTIISLIRNDIRFDGLLMTDDISMGALSGSIAQRSQAAIAAGCDLVLHCNGDFGEMEAVVEATGRLSERAKTRAEAALAARGSAASGEFDAKAAEAMYEQIIKGQADA
ncbi:MAG: glycoside hydrolase family 3 N-terminal domain-containing protein [Pseudomonadota bacterium]